MYATALRFEMILCRLDQWLLSSIDFQPRHATGHVLPNGVGELKVHRGRVFLVILTRNSSEFCKATHDMAVQQNSL